MNTRSKSLSPGSRVGTVIKTVLMYLLFLIYMLPFVLVIINSLKQKANIVKFPLDLTDPAGPQFVNYLTASQKMDFLKAFFNSTTVTLVSVAFILFLSSMASYLFARKNWKICRASFSVMLASMILPFQVVMIPLISIYGAQFGILNSRLTLIFMNIGFGVSLSTFMCHGYIRTNIPIALEEAATIDGCSPFRCFFSVVFPLLRPILSTIGVLEVLNIWNDFLLPSLVLRRKELYTLPIAIRTFYGTFSNDFGYIMAGLVLSVLPIIILYIFLQKYVIGGVVAGAVKA